MRAQSRLRKRRKRTQIQGKTQRQRKMVWRNKWMKGTVGRIRIMIMVLAVNMMFSVFSLAAMASTPVIDQYFQKRVTVNVENGTAVFEDSMMGNYFSTDDQGGKLTGTVVYSGVTFYYDAENELAIESLLSDGTLWEVLTAL